MIRVSAVLLSMTVASAVRAVEPPAVEVCRFLDGKSAAISLTFDDGCKDHATLAAPLLEKYGYHGTFYVVVKRVPAKPNDRRLTWAELKALAERGHEIGNHSMTHYQLTKAKDAAALKQEIIEPIAIIEEHVGVRPVTYCYPGNAKNAEIVKLAESVHIGSTKCHRHFYGGEDFSVQKQAGWLDNAIAKGQSMNAMFHGIVPDGGGWKPFKNVEVFEEILKSFKQRDKDLWVCTFADISKYEKLRDSATIERQDTDTSLILTMKSTVQYGAPLTVKVTPCPPEWTATQAGKTIGIVRRDGSAYLNVIPENGPVTLAAE